MRKGAFFDLDAMGVTEPLPEPGTCGKLPAKGGASACHACTFIWTQFGSGGGSSGIGVRVAVTAELAKPEPIPERPKAPAELAATRPTEGFLGVAAADLLLTEAMEDLLPLPRRGCGLPRPLRQGARGDDLPRRLCARARGGARLPHRRRRQEEDERRRGVASEEPLQPVRSADTPARE